jgi:hypothetical protein
LPTGAGAHWRVSPNGSGLLKLTRSPIRYIRCHAADSLALRRTFNQAM